MAKKVEETDDDDGSAVVLSNYVTNKAAAMVVWTQRMAFALGFCAFIIMFLISYDFSAYMELRTIIISMIKGLCAGLLFWLGGLIIGNIILKGLITDIPVDQSHLVDGGILQRIYLYQQRLNYDTDGNVIQIDPRTDTIVRKTVTPKK